MDIIIKARKSVYILFRSSQIPSSMSIMYFLMRFHCAFHTWLEKICLSSFQQKQTDRDFEFLEWDICDLRCKGQSVSKLQIFFPLFQNASKTSREHIQCWCTFWTYWVNANDEENPRLDSSISKLESREWRGNFLQRRLFHWWPFKFYSRIYKLEFSANFWWEPRWRLWIVHR